MNIREDYVFKAKLAQQTNRFDLMSESMKMVVMIDAELTEEERDLLSDAYKSAIDNRRSTLKTIRCIEKIEEMRGKESRYELVKQFRIQVEKESRDICDEILELLEQYIIPVASKPIPIAIYHKLKGDYYKYLSEFTYEEERHEFLDKSRVSYMIASNKLWSQLRIDIDVLAKLHGCEDKKFKKLAQIKELSAILRSVESYFNIFTLDKQQIGVKQQIDSSRKKWITTNYILSL